MVEPSKVEIQFDLTRKKPKPKNWFNDLKKIHHGSSSDVESHGDNLIPVPGCTQGGFVPYILK